MKRQNLRGIQAREYSRIKKKKTDINKAKNAIELNSN